MTRVRSILSGCQIYSGGLNITGDVTERVISALENVESGRSTSDNIPMLSAAQIAAFSDITQKLNVVALEVNTLAGAVIDLRQQLQHR